MHAENLRVELWGPFLTVSGTRKGSAMGMRAQAKHSAAGGGKGIILRREMDYGFFSASWRLPVSPSESRWAIADSFCHLVSSHVPMLRCLRPSISLSG